MKMKIKKIISMILVAVLLLACVSCSSKDKKAEEFVLPERAQVDTSLHTFGFYEYFVYDDDTVAIYSYSGEESDVRIPDEINGKKVVEICPSAFLKNSYIKSVTMGDNLEVIGMGAFASCPSLSSVTFGKKVWNISINAFDETPFIDSLKDEFVIVGDSVLLLYNGNKDTVDVPDGVRHISSAFAQSTTIDDVKLPDSVLTIGRYAFSASSIKNIYFGNNLRYVGGMAFMDCDYLTYVDLPDTVEYIDEYAFSRCPSLYAVNLGASVKKIEQYAFYQCSNVKYIYMPKTVTSIGDYAFSDWYSILVVYYEGTESDFNALGLTGNNSFIIDAKKLYEYKRG